MKYSYLYLFGLLACITLQAQNAYHVFPKTHKVTPGKPGGNGSLELPWDLKTALSNRKNIQPGDTLYLHKGQYDGRYISTLKGTKHKQIVVTAFKNDEVVINGNVTSKHAAILQVRGEYVSFKNFEITFKGVFSRTVSDPNFKAVTGISHTLGVACKFINLKIHNIPGSGIGSWKHAGGSVIKNCMIFNNGYIGKQRGHGVGIYVQNKSNQTRRIINNVIFNNYYKGIQVWSATPNTTFEYVKNVQLQGNIVFNNGLPSGVHRGNIFIGTNDNSGINFAKNITVDHNILYHNTDVLKDAKNFGNGASLTLGYKASAPVKNVRIINNVIIGKNNAFSIVNAQNLNVENNHVYCGYVHFNAKAIKNVNKKQWSFKNNQYYTRKLHGFRVSKQKDYTLNQWQDTFKLETQSNLKNLANFTLDPVLAIYKNEENTTQFTIALFDKEGKDIPVDFSAHGIAKHTSYSIKNIEDGTTIKSGKVDSNKMVVFPMGVYNQTVENFGVYTIEFKGRTSTNKKRKGLFKRLFGM